MNLFWLLLSLLGLVGLESWLLGTRALRKVHFERFFSRSAVFEGDRIELVERLQNRKWLPVPWLRVESRISSTLAFAAEADREISEQYHCSFFHLGGRMQVTRRYGVTCTHRGAYSASTAVLTGGDLFGASSAVIPVEQPLSILVYPRLLDLSEVPFPASRWQGEVLVRRFIAPDPFLFSGIREWQLGDAMRDVHWRATARSTALMVKQHDATVAPQAMVLLNVQTAENLWGLMNEEELLSVERGISVAATMLMAALDSGLDAGFGCNGHLKGETGTILITPARGDIQRTRILEACARLEPQRELSFHTFLDELAPKLRNQDILLLSLYDSEKIREAVALLRRNGNTVTVSPLAVLAPKPAVASAPQEGRGAA